MLKLVVSKGAAMELRGMARCLEDEPASPGAARSFIQEFKHRAELACSLPCSRPLALIPSLRRGATVRFGRAGLSQSIPSQMIASRSSMYSTSRRIMSAMFWSNAFALGML